MQPTPLLILVAIELLGLVLLGWIILQINRFLASTKTISSDLEMDQLKSIAAKNMYVALATIPLLGGPWIMYLLGVAKGSFLVADYWLLATPSMGYPLLGLISTLLERRLKSLPTETSELEQQRDRVLKCWKTRAWPNWK